MGIHTKEFVSGLHPYKTVDSGIHAYEKLPGEYIHIKEFDLVINTKEFGPDIHIKELDLAIHIK